MRGDFPGDIGADRSHALDRTQPGGDRLANGFYLAFGRIGQFDVKADAAAVDLDIARHFADGEALAGVRVDDFGQCGLDLRFSYCHRGSCLPQGVPCDG